MAWPLALLAAATAFKTDPCVDYVDKYLQQSKIPGMVGILSRPHHSDLDFAEGYANLETKKPISSDMVFDYGSINKMLTTVTVLRLYEEGKLKLTDTLGDYVPEVNSTWKKATVAQMLSHTSGLPEYVLYPGITLLENFRQKKWFEVMADKPLDFDPGSEFQYSNTNFFMLMLIAEKATGRPWPDLLTQYVLKPAGMTETGPELSAQQIESRKPVGYWIEDTVEPIQPAGKSPDHGSGSYFSTASDLKKFADALFGGQLLKPATFKLMTTPAPIAHGRKASYGFGLFLRKVNGIDIWSHGGNSVGYAGSVTYVPSKHLTLVILANAYQMSGDAVALRIIQQIEPDLVPKPFETTSDPDSKRSEFLLKTLQDLAAQNLDSAGMDAEMKDRLSRPRGRMAMQTFARYAKAEFDAYLGSESSPPDTIVRLRVKVGETKYLATFSIDSNGLVYSIAMTAIS